MAACCLWGLLGFGGVAVSLGLKDLVADFIAGLTMLTNPTFKVGDNIKAGAVMGTVMGIGATKTTLLTRTGTGKTPHTISNNVLSFLPAAIIGFLCGVISAGFTGGNLFLIKVCRAHHAHVCGCGCVCVGTYIHIHTYTYTSCTSMCLCAQACLWPARAQARPWPTQQVRKVWINPNRGLRVLEPIVIVLVTTVGLESPACMPTCHL